ncbi:23S rRNA (uracil(1939)-C(5))-methyltransferase RlmD [Proteiniborus sp. MB09-C3]|uniref:23S rRNA (uracil(1939)-C(5))-methyltransferase RlmD n=1 Tax=Proteiniborus sp. MB09-C3 TaxID=3050072 RepID=UPI00332EBCDA
MPNKGLAKVGDNRIIVKDAIKGQKVKIRITKKRKDKIEGKVLEVLEKSPIEKEPFCRHFGACGGCSYQTLSYEEQLNIKSNQVTKLLRDAGIKDFEYLGIEPSPLEYDYRNKMEFTFGDVEKGGELSLGLHQKGKFYEIVTVEGCQIVDSDFIKILTNTLDYFREKGVELYNKRSHKGVLRHLVVRKAIKTGELLVNLVTTSQQQLKLDELIERLKDIEYRGRLVGFLHTVNDNFSDTVQSDETKILFGRDYIVEEILGLKFKISAFSFFQTNTLGAEKLYSIVRDFAGDKKDKLIYDLYCGTGTIAQIMATVARKVVGIEIVEEAVESAEENAKLNGLDNCHFIAGDVMEKVSELNEKPDLIILDPPRDGIHPKAIQKIIDFEPEEFIYVSCNPKSLARDLPVFEERGYKVQKVKCMDMFPHTPHTECVTICRKIE